MDKANYPANWKEIVKHINERAGNKCEWCGAPNGETIRRHKGNKALWVLSASITQMPDEDYEQYDRKEIRVMLTTAHLNHDTTDNRDDNLAALCQYHHLNHDAKYHASNARKTRGRKKAELAKVTGQLSLFD